MSTDTAETGTGRDSRDEEEWSSDEAGAAQREMTAAGFGSAGDVEPDEAPAADEPAASEGFVQNTSTTADERLSGSDSALGTDGDLTPHPDPQDSPVPEGVAKPEDLGGRDIGAGGEPLVAAETQEEFLNRWTGIQVSFLEDPSGAFESAAALVDEISATIRASLEERGNELAAGGRAASDTEQLRLALRQYRAFIGVILPK